MSGILIGMALAAGALVLLHDWRLAIPLLLASDLLRIAWLWQAAPLPQGRASLVLAELATAAGVAAILLISASQAAPPAHGRGSQLQLAATALAVAACAAPAVFAARGYPLSGDRGLDAVVLFGALCSLLVLLGARDALKLGLGQLLLAGSIKLLYFGAGARLLVLHVVLWEALSLALALVAAAFCGLLYGRLVALELETLPGAEP